MSFDIPMDSQGERALVVMVRGEERREGGRSQRGPREVGDDAIEGGGGVPEGGRTRGELTGGRRGGRGRGGWRGRRARNNKRMTVSNNTLLPSTTK